MTVSVSCACGWRLELHNLAVLAGAGDEDVLLRHLPDTLLDAHDAQAHGGEK